MPDAFFDIAEFQLQRREEPPHGSELTRVRILLDFADRRLIDRDVATAKWELGRLRAEAGLVPPSRHAGLANDIAQGELTGHASL